VPPSDRANFDDTVVQRVRDTFVIGLA